MTPEAATRSGTGLHDIARVNAPSTTIRSERRKCDGERHQQRVLVTAGPLTISDDEAASSRITLSLSPGSVGENAGRTRGCAEGAIG